MLNRPQSLKARIRAALRLADLTRPQLATMLCANWHAINNAVQDLRKQGALGTRPGKGSRNGRPAEIYFHAPLTERI